MPDLKKANRVSRMNPNQKSRTEVDSWLAAFCTRLGSVSWEVESEGEGPPVGLLPSR